jgi:hypothetical protein
MRISRTNDYHRRHFATSKLYCGIDKTGQTKSVLAYTKAEARESLRKTGFRPVKIVQS